MARLTAARQTVPPANGHAVLVPDPLLAGAVVARGFAFGSVHSGVRAAGGGVGGRAVGAQVRAGVATGRDRDPSLWARAPGQSVARLITLRKRALTHPLRALGRRPLGDSDAWNRDPRVIGRCTAHLLRLKPLHAPNKGEMSTHEAGFGDVASLAEPVSISPP